MSLLLAGFISEIDKEAFLGPLAGFAAKKIITPLARLATKGSVNVAKSAFTTGAKAVGKTAVGAGKYVAKNPGSALGLGLTVPFVAMDAASVAGKTKGFTAGQTAMRAPTMEGWTPQSHSYI